MFLMFQLRRLNVWPTGDLGMRKGFGLAWDADASSETTRGARPPVSALSPVAVHEGEGRHQRTIEPLLVIHEADHPLRFDLFRKEIP
jgi:3-methyladenine DNA glycosylase/8-oxoguanine DNA glycosylase